MLRVSKGGGIDGLNAAVFRNLGKNQLSLPVVHPQLLELK